MNKDEVPQQNAKAFMGRSKALYALNEKGEYGIVPSTGWEAEEIVLDQAIAEFEAAFQDAHARAKAGQASPLEYHMYRCRMDLLVLAQSTGFFQWTIKRDFKPGALDSMSGPRLAAYAQALGLSVQQLKSLPELP
jgi:hypothetical protein